MPTATAGASAGIAALRKALSSSEAQPVPWQARRIGKGQERADQVAQAAADEANGGLLPPAQPGAAGGDGNLPLAFKPRKGVEPRAGDALLVSDSHPKNAGEEQRYEIRRALGEETPGEDVAHHHPIDPLYVGGTPFGIGLGAGSGAGRQGAGSGPPAPAPALGAAGSQTPAVMRPARTPAPVPTPVPVSTPAPTSPPSPASLPAPALSPTLVPVPSRTPVVPPLHISARHHRAGLNGFHAENLPK